MIESSVIQDLSKKWIAQGVEQGIEQGREEGIEQGRQEGIEQGIEQGIERGQKLQAREAVFTVLTVRFQTEAVERLKPLMEAIDDLDYLNQLHLAAAKADSIEDFRNALFNINP